MMSWLGGTGFMGAAGWIGMAFMIVFWVAVVIGVVYLIRYLVARPPARWDERRRHEQGPYENSDRSSDALRTLENRYARGEVDQQEFIRRRNDILEISG